MLKIWRNHQVQDWKHPRQDSTLAKSLALSRDYATAFWNLAQSQPVYSDDYRPSYDGAPAGYTPYSNTEKWYPDTSRWPLYYGTSRWPPPTGVFLNSTMAYKAMEMLSAVARGHQYPGNFAKDGSIRQ